MTLPTPRSTRSDTRLPYTALFRSRRMYPAGVWVEQASICQRDASQLLGLGAIHGMKQTGCVGAGELVVTRSFFIVKCNLQHATGAPILSLLQVAQQIGRAHVCTPVTNAHLVCRLLLTTNKTQ